MCIRDSCWSMYHNETAFIRDRLQLKVGFYSIFRPLSTFDVTAGITHKLEICKCLNFVSISLISFLFARVMVVTIHKPHMFILVLGFTGIAKWLQRAVDSSKELWRAPKCSGELLGAPGSSLEAPESPKNGHLAFSMQWF